MEFEKLLQDPRASFNSPSQIVNSNDLSKSQKIELLRRWEYDAEQLQAAEGEGMNSDRNEGEMLQRVLEALKSLGERPGSK
tara:strand:+ start:1570 stop:1812 length:243 start_codon:yes stop_codon:yes gene_type:complete